MRRQEGGPWKEVPVAEPKAPMKAQNSMARLPSSQREILQPLDKYNLKQDRLRVTQTDFGVKENSYLENNGQRLMLNRSQEDLSGQLLTFDYSGDR